MRANTSSRLVVALAVGLLAGASRSDAATIYEFTILDVPGASSTAASGINAAGQIVGSYTDASGSHGFVRDGTTYTSLDYPGATATDAGGINDGAQVVGTYTAAGKTYGYLKDGGTYMSFEVPPLGQYNIHFDTFGRGINDAGKIVGSTTFMSDTQGSYETYWTAGNIQVWGVFAADSFTTSVAYGINGAGQIVGLINSFYPGTHGYLVDGGTLTTFDVPDAGDTYAFGINEGGQIVGQFYAAGSFLYPHGFVKDGTTYTQLDVPDALATAARGINDAGSIVGDFRDALGTTHGFLATPVPEPASLLLVSSGLAALLTWRRQATRSSPSTG